MKCLYLHVKSRYFAEIAEGKKFEEYRLYNSYWKKRLISNSYDKIVIFRGYPKKDNAKARIERKWIGWRIKEIIHPHFGDRPVAVFAIQVND